MTADQFLSRIGKGSLPSAYLFLGQESYGRKLCREALLARAISDGNRQDKLSQFDLENISVSEALDDARSLSLFATERVIWISSAELALPRRMNTTAEENGKDGDSGALSGYLAAPTPGVTVVFECSRYDFTGDDKARIDRVSKFYSAVPVTVEFRHYTPDSSRALAGRLAEEHRLQIGSNELNALLEAVDGDAGRLASEMEKLAFYVGTERKVTEEDLQLLVPNAAGSTIFALVNALGNRNRNAALRSLDVLIRTGEYLPLALTFLSAQFRLALAARERKITSSGQAMSEFGKLGVRMWRDRAEQVVATASAFSLPALQKALAAIYEADKRFRDGYRDDLVVMEALVFALTDKGSEKASRA